MGISGFLILNTPGTYQGYLIFIKEYKGLIKRPSSGTISIFFNVSVQFISCVNWTS